MIELISLEIFLFFIAAASYGFGFHIAGSKFHSIKLIQGLFFILFALSTLSLLALEVRASLPSLLIIGFALFIRSSYINYSAIIKNRKNLLYFLAITVLALTYLTLSEGFPAAYNFHDDFQKYFLHPAKYLGQGFFGDSPLSTLGKETFGGQAIGQSIFIFFLGFDSINLFDAVFCKAVLAIGIFEIGHRYNKIYSAILIAAISILIHPQYVNISSVYSLALACFCIVVLHHEILSSAYPKEKFYNFGLLLGLAYAFSITLKTSYIILPLVHFPLLMISLLYSRTSQGNQSIAKGDLFVWGLLSTAFGLVYLAPWIVKPLQFYLANPGTDGMSAPITPDFFKTVALLDPASTFYGASPLFYTATIFSGALLSMFASLLPQNRSFTLPAGTAILSVIIISIYLVAFVGNEFHDFGTVLRYSIPFIVGLSSSSIIIALCALQDFNFEGLLFGIRLETEGFRLANSFAIGVLLLLLTLWIPVHREFLSQYFKCGSKLAFSDLACSEEYMAYNSYVLSGSARTRIRGLQNRVPEGETILAWVNYGHHLDFSRNSIIEIDTAGLRNPWAFIPDASYLIVDLGGYATRSKNQLISLESNSSSYDKQIWQASLKFIEYLEKNLIVLDAVNDEELFLYRIALPKNRRYK